MIINGIIKDKYINPAICTAGLMLLVLTSFFNVNIYDEAIGLIGAERVAGGELPYLNFWTIYSPGIYYLLAFIMKLTGWNIITGRIVSIFCIFGLAIVIKQITEKMTGSKIISLVIYGVVIILFAAHPQNSRAMPPALLSASLSILFFIKFQENNKQSFIASSAFFNALTILFRQDTGAYLFFANITILMLYLLFIMKSGIFKTILLYKLVIITVLALPLYLLISQAGFDRVYNQLFEVPAKIFPLYRSLPVPLPFVNLEGKTTLSQTISRIWGSYAFFLSPVIFLFLMIFLAKRGFRELKNIKSMMFFYVGLCSIIFFAQASVRSDAEHALPSLIFALICLSHLLLSGSLKYKYQVLFLLVLILISLPLAKAGVTVKSTFSSSAQTVHSGRAKYLKLSTEMKNEFGKIKDFFDSCTKKDDKIFVGNSRHDKLVLNDAMLYFICERTPGTIYHELHPGIATASPVQKQIIRELHTNKVNYVILSKAENIQEPNLSSVSSGVKLLDNYLASEYKTVLELKNYRILKKITFSEQQFRPYVP